MRELGRRSPGRVRHDRRSGARGARGSLRPGGQARALLPAGLAGLALQASIVGLLAIQAAGAVAAAAAPAAASDGHGAAPDAAPAQPAPTDHAAAAAGVASGPRPIMHEVFDALIELLPQVLDAEALDALEPEQARARLEAPLDRLVAATDELESHARWRDEDFRALADLLATDLVRAQRRLEEGNVASARFYVVTATQACVACHSRLPAARSFPLGRQLIDRIGPAKLSPLDRALLRVVGRDFDGALREWEAALADPSVTGGTLTLSRVLDDYLRVAIRVVRDPERARATLARTARRPDLDPELRRAIRAWERALVELAPELEAEPTLARARAVLERAPTADAASLPGWASARRVHEQVASSLLLRLIDAHPRGGPQTARAFFELGRIEVESPASPWSPLAQRHLETAIRLAPGAPFARQAYAMLEDYVRFGYGGSGGLHIPDDVSAELRALRARIDAAQGARPAP